MALLPFWLRPLFALELLLLPFALRLLFALELVPLPFALRLLFARALVPLPFELPLLFALEPRRVVAPGRFPLCAFVVRRERLPEGLEARVPDVRAFRPLLAPARFVPPRLGFDRLVPFEVRAGPLLLPSFEVNASTASRGACAVLRAPLATFVADWLTSDLLLRLVTSLAIRRAPICTTVAAPAPAAKAPAVDAGGVVRT